ncbi:MAG: DUF2062 domain-containing protein, partial [Phyllobacterium sp.]
AMLRHLDFAVLWRPLVEPMLIGAIPLGLAAALLVYLPVRWTVSGFQHRRRPHFRLQKAGETT